MPYMPDTMPIPDVKDQWTGGFWEHTKKHELVVQKCSDCGTFRHTPAPLCYNCLSWNYEWHKLSGKGIIFSYIINHYPALGVLKEKVPYNVLIVEIPEAGNIRMVGNLIDGTPNEDIRCGMEVEVVWEDIDDDVTLPQWKRAG